MSEAPELTRTLLLTVALPDFYAEDITQEGADEFYDGDVTELAYESMSLISSTMRLLLMTGDKGGNDMHDARAVLIRAETVAREPQHDEPEDERLTDAILDWREETQTPHIIEEHPGGEK